MKRFSASLALGISLLFVAGPSIRAQIIFDGAAAGLNGKPLLVDRVFVGLVGDAVDLAVGSHRVEIAADHDIPLVLEVVRGNSGVTVSVNVERRRGCPNGPVVELTEWQAPALSAGPGATTRIVLEKPIYAATPFGCRSDALTMTCTDAMQIEIKSVPESAEIWANRKRVAKTNSTLSVPFCWRDNAKEYTDIVVRLPGYITCPVRIELERGVTRAATCTLRKL